MKFFLTTILALGAVLMLEANQPAQATVFEPTASAYDHNQITPAYWHRHGYWYGDPYYYEPYYYRPGFHFRFGF